MRAGISGLAVSNRGGLGRLSRIYLLALAQARPDWELNVYLRSREDLELLKEECDSRRRALVDQFVVHFPPLPGLNRLILEEMLLPAAFSRLKLDCYLGCDFTLPPARLAQRECVVIPDLLPLTQPATVSWRARLLYRRGIRRSLARKASLLFISQHGMDTAARVLGESPQGSRVIYPALSPRFEALSQTAAMSDYALQVRGSVANLQDPGRYLLYVGSFEKRKNVKLLCDCFVSLVMDGHYRGSLVLVGGDGRFSTVKPQAEFTPQFAGFPEAAPEKSAEIHDLGRVSDTDLSQLYRSADMLVNLSTEEGFGYPVLESLAHGTPALITKGSAMAEISEQAIVECPLERNACENTLIDAIGSAQILRQEAAAFDLSNWTIDRLGQELAEALEDLPNR